MDVAAYLRAARGTRKVSQRALAALADVPVSTLDRIEAGVTDPRISTVAKLFGALGYYLTVANDPGRPLRLDETREQLIDGRGRHFPPHWEYEEITGNWDDRWWGHYRNKMRQRSWRPSHTYWFRHPSVGFTPWEDAT
ncbi:MAG TPA: helix-turn-helix transcriptional regulator [Jatrophihabitans sp.]|nr:helix-turn-helix transcriptional regulator [Jatrophihabitans sp.]